MVDENIEYAEEDPISKRRIICKILRMRDGEKSMCNEMGNGENNII